MELDKAKALRAKLPTRMNLGDPAEVKERDEVSKLINQQHQNDLRFLLGMVEGRRFLWRMLCMWRMNENDCDINNMYNTAFLLGIKSSSDCLKNEILKISKEHYMLMFSENFGADK